MVYATGSLGELGIAPGHTPLLTGLAPGPVRLETENGEETFFCSGGFIEIQPNEVTFLADTAERADSLDEAEAIKAQELAQKELSDRDADMDFTKAAAQLAEKSQVSAGPASTLRLRGGRQQQRAMGFQQPCQVISGDPAVDCQSLP